ncbi:hypothetical protein L2E82_08036 [Cichorium intybus]|uniref:Uncharacterized protein n=1 Tax=Cichorium intybus TaxID=13427 RepID=A0ACB9G5G2_CICIN|nr:hypothetical protein L2E82_08036 [Cichorium intybus]
MHFNILIAIAAMRALGAVNAQEVSNCERSCGNVNITYPFGSGVGCYYSSDFLVTCNRSSGTPIPFFGNSSSNIVISNMSTSKSELEIMMFVARDCYNSSGPAGWSRPSLWLKSMRISTKNKFVAIGCDTYAFFRARRGSAYDGTGCISRCGSNSSITDGSCSGVGCCEVAVPEGMSAINITLSSYDNHTDMIDFNPCSYAFFVEEGKFNFFSNNLRDFRSTEKMPMLLDWAIGNSTCDIASKEVDNFLCKAERNSRCDENYRGRGYRCRCHEGYEGNPYVGCNSKCYSLVTWFLYFIFQSLLHQSLPPNEILDHLYSADIDECKNGNHDCVHISDCKDNPGNYTCECREGYSGDGRNDGTGCIADQYQDQDQSMVVKIAVGK